MLGFTAIFAAVVLMRMRAELAEAKVEARLRRSGRRMNPWPFVIAAYAVDRRSRPPALVAVGLCDRCAGPRPRPTR